MNVYDFDKTIYAGDCTIDFYFFCLRKKPSVLFSIPYQIKGFLLYSFGKISKTKFKEYFFSFLIKLNGLTDEYVIEFWSKYERKIKHWYKMQHSQEDLIISASPYFLLEHICKKLGMREPIASLVDEKNGKFICVNCYGEEKVKRFQATYPLCKIEAFYSDSKSDRPMAELAKKAYLVKKNKIKQWDL